MVMRCSKNSLRIKEVIMGLKKSYMLPNDYALCDRTREERCIEKIMDIFGESWFNNASNFLYEIEYMEELCRLTLKSNDEIILFPYIRVDYMASLLLSLWDQSKDKETLDKICNLIFLSEINGTLLKSFRDAIITMYNKIFITGNIND